MSEGLSPTIVIGVGKAGCRMARSVEQVVEREDKEGQFEFVAIDTNQRELHEESPDSVRPKYLQVPEADQRWKNAKDRFSYLTIDYDISRSEGVTRQRAVSRYHIDNRESFTEVRRFLESTIKRFISEHEMSVERQLADANVWLLNSLGGGTGSGSFPLLATMIKQITETIDEDVFVGGIGSLPRLDNDEIQIEYPEGNERFYTNAYAALRELRELVNYEDRDDRYPIRLRIESDDPNVSSDHIEIDESPFDQYYLLGFDESRNDPSYRRQMNATAANAIYYHSGISENFPDQDRLRENNTLFSLAAAQVHAPVETARELIRLNGEIEDLNDEAETLADEIDDHDSSIRYLSELLYEIDDLSYDTVPDEAEDVSLELVRDTRGQATSIRVADVMGEEFDLDERVSALVDEKIDSLTRSLTDDRKLPEGGFEASDVVARIFCEQLYSYVENQLAEHDFPGTVEDVWNDQEGIETSDCGYLRDEPPTRKWEDGLEEYLYERWVDLTEQAESTSSILHPIKVSRLNKRAEQKSQQLETLRNLYAEYNALDELSIEAESRLDGARQRLKRSKQEIESTREAKARTRRETEKTLRTRESKRRNLAERLTDFDPEPGRIDLPFLDPETLTEDVLDASTSIASLIDDDLISPRHVQLALRNTLRGSDLQEPVQDVVRDHDAPSPRTILGVISNSENVGEETNLLKLDLLEDDNPVDMMIDTLADYDRTGEVQEIDDGYSIWFVAFFTPITLENTTEYGVLHEHYRDSFSEVREKVGGDIGDDDVTLSFAYPELFDDDDRIVETFGPQS